MALAALQGGQTVVDLAGRYGVLPNQIPNWRKQLLDVADTVFASAAGGRDKEQEALISELYG